MSDKKDFLEKQKQSLEEWRKHVEELSKKAKTMQVEASVRYDNIVEDLRERIEVVRAEIEKIQHSSDSRWDQVKTGVDRAWDELKDAVNKARSRFG